jgi:hypothetical protein
VTERSKEMVCGHSVAGIAGSKPTEDVGACFMSIFCACMVEVSAMG